MQCVILIDVILMSHFSTEIDIFRFVSILAVTTINYLTLNSENTCLSKGHLLEMYEYNSSQTIRHSLLMSLLGLF